MDLKKLIVDTREVEADYPGVEGFKVKVANVSRVVSEKIRVASMSTHFDKGTRTPVERLDHKLFSKNFAKHAIKGWSGLTYRNLEHFILVDLSEIEDVDAELVYTPENAEILLENSTEFATWLNEMVFDIDNFRTAK